MEGMSPYSLIHDEADLFQPGHQQPKAGGHPSILYQQKLSKLVLRWFKCEYFYSWIDRPFFLSNDFKQLLTSLDLSNQKMTKLEWSLVKKTILSS